MSVSSLADVAFLRRTDVEVPNVPTTGPADPLTRRLELVNTPTPDAQTSISIALKVIATYIPSEVLTLYVAVIAAIRTPGQMDRGMSIAFYSFLVITPLVVWLVYAAKCKGAGKPLPLPPRTWPLWEMFAAAVAYAAWAFALSDNPFSIFDWYSSALAGVIVMIVSTSLGLLAPVFQRPINA